MLEQKQDNFFRVDLAPTRSLEEYSAIPEFHAAIEELRTEAEQAIPLLQKGATVWMINSTNQGGGVAEMAPKMVQLFRELGVQMEWGVIQPKLPAFFHFTKRLHNMIHGLGDQEISLEEAQVYEQVNAELAANVKTYIKKNDILIIHDPQPMALGAILKRELGNTVIWRCHIGTETKNATTKSVWKFLQPYAKLYDYGIFSAMEYVPSYFSGRAAIIHPALDPLSYKNSSLSPHKLSGILKNAHLEKSIHPVVTPNYTHPAKRLQSDGNFLNAYLPESLGLLHRPIITQISRWDRLKGFPPLIKAFVLLKQDLLNTKKKKGKETEYRRLELVRLVLAGPDPSSIQDDPEGQDVLRELITLYTSLEKGYQKDIAIFTLPMASLKENALMTNSLQRCSSIIVQNSIQEGFGLTITEAMWKGIPVLTSHAVGPKQQIRHKIDGYLIKNPENPKEIKTALKEMLIDNQKRRLYGESARRHAYQKFLIFRQIQKWLQVLVKFPINSINH